MEGIREYAKREFQGLRYLVLADGPIALEDIEIVGPSGRNDAAYSESSRAAISRAVEKAVLSAAKSGQSLFDSALVRLANVIEISTAARKTWKLGVGRTSYFEYVGTRGMLYSGSIEKYANPIGSAIIAITEDGYIPFGRRADHLEVNPGRIFSFGGFFEADTDVTPTGSPCIYSCLHRELLEELGAEVAADDMRLQSIIYDLRHPHPEIIATALLRGWTKEDVASSGWSAELASLEFVHCDQLQQFIFDKSSDITEGLLGGLCSFLGKELGQRDMMEPCF